MRKIGAVILAAGGSSRLEQPKQLLTFRGKTLIRTTIDATCEAGCSPVAVVIGSDIEAIQRELENTNVVEVINANWQRGIGSSIRVGVQALTEQSPGVAAIVLLVCDQPAVSARVIERLIAAHEVTKRNIVASSYADTVGVPALFDRSLFNELLALGDESGAKSLMLRNHERVVQVPFPEGTIDVDTAADYEKLRDGEDRVQKERKTKRDESPANESSGV